jgi:hypothetical protein
VKKEAFGGEEVDRQSDRTLAGADTGCFRDDVPTINRDATAIIQYVVEPGLGDFLI